MHSALHREVDEETGLKIEIVDLAGWREQRGLPADGRAEVPFDEVVEVGPDAPLIDRLVAWNGRDPYAMS